MQVRYQAAPRPDRNGDNRSAAQYAQHFFELEPYLPYDLLALADVAAGFIAAELVARTANRESLLIQQAANLTDDDDILTLVVTAIAAPLDGFELRKLLLPVTQHVRLDAAQITNLTDRKVTLAGN